MSHYNMLILLLEPSPLQSNCTLINKMCIVLYFEVILFEINIISFKKKLINSENKYFPEKK